MTEDPVAEAQRMLNEAAPKAARIVLEGYTGQDDLPLADLLLTGLDKLPQSGRIRKKGDNQAIKAICLLIDELPDSEPQGGEIVRRCNEAWSRSSYNPR